MKKTFAIAAIAAFFSTAASADALFDGVVQQLVNQGYQNIKVQETPSTYTFRSQMGNATREIIVDRRTGALLADNNFANRTFVVQQPQQPQVGFAPQQPAVNPGDQIAAQVVGAVIGHIFDQMN